MPHKKEYFHQLLILCLAFICAKSFAQSPLEKRIDQLVHQMSVQEKIDQLTNNSFGGTSTNKRLNIPGFLMDDGPHGVRFASEGSGKKATAFPTGIAMAATWDEAICERVGLAMGQEFWAFNRTQQLGPCIDIARDSRGGRTAESGGEDPYLAGKLGTALAKGIQKSPVIATVKHFVGESKQANRHKMNVLLEKRWIYDFAGYNFRKVVQDAGVMSVMGAYNLLNDDKCCENRFLLTNILRESWGFPFYVVSDWDAIWDTQKAINAGTDICMGSQKYKDDLPILVEKGLVSTQVLDEAVKNVLKTKILSGMMDYHRPKGDSTFAKTTPINNTNLLAARKSIILLKNERIKQNRKILPLAKKKLTVALIGPNSDAKNLNCFGSSETFPPYSISIKEGIESKIGKDKVIFEKGCDINSERTDGFESAKRAASNADVVIFAGGLDATQEGEGYDWGTDRKGESTALPRMQQRLINELASVNPNLILVVQSGGVCSLNHCLPNIKGLVYSFYAAQEAGRAIADVLFGDYNPAGRMPVTMPKKDEDIPSWEEDSFRRFSDYYGFGYRWFDQKNIKPEFAFGFGLSYSKFEYTRIIAPKTVECGAPFTVYVEVANKSNIAGEEVVQVYISSPSNKIWMPVKELRGFKRISFKAGEKKLVPFRFCADDFYHWDEQLNSYCVESGMYKIMAGGSSDNLGLTSTVQLLNSEQKPDLEVTQLFTMPRYPAKTDKISFYTLVKNQGNATYNKPYSIAYFCGNKLLLKETYTNLSIRPGQAKLIHTNSEILAKNINSQPIKVQIQPGEPKIEWDTNNNQFFKRIVISE